MKLVACPRRGLTQNRRTLTQGEQTEYLDAVQCFLSKPGITPKDVAPGAVSRYDDLIATHIHQTFDIHYVVGGTRTILLWISLTLSRVIFSRGTGGSPLSTRRDCATSVATEVLSHTGTGRWM